MLVLVTWEPAVRKIAAPKSTRTLRLRASLMCATLDWVEDRDSLAYLRGAPKLNT